MSNSNPDFARWNQLARQFLGDDFFSDMMGTNQSKEPDVDVYQGKNEVIVVMDLPGMEDINSLDIRVEGETMWVKGIYSSPYHSYHATLTERKRGEFQKTIPLGVPVSKQCSMARYRRGILELRFPKMQINQSQNKIRVKNQDRDR